LYNTARDLYLRIEETKKQHPKLKCFLYGGSMGGLVAALMAKEESLISSQSVFGAETGSRH